MTDLAVQLHEANRRLDAIDRKILTVLQEDASLSVAEIGDRVGLSSTPCWKRIQRLEADGVILRRVALVDQNKIGLGISVFVSVESADHSEAWLKTFADAVSAMPEVMEFYRMAGDVDYMLRVVVADMAELRRVLQKADQRRAAEERHLALCDGEDQVGHRAAGAGGVIDLRLSERIDSRRAVQDSRARCVQLTEHLPRISFGLIFSPGWSGEQPSRRRDGPPG